MSAWYEQSSLSSSSSLLALLSSFCGYGCGGGGNAATPEWPRGNVVLHDVNNYGAQSTLTIPAVQTAPGADLAVCWDGIVKDIDRRRHP